MTAAAAFNVLYVLLTEWSRIGLDLDVEKLDAVLDGWDPEAEERLGRAIQGSLRGTVG